MTLEHHHSEERKCSYINNSTIEDDTLISHHHTSLSPNSQPASIREDQKKTAADSLGKYVKAELRPDHSVDGFHQIEMAQYHKGNDSRRTMSMTRIRPNKKGGDEMPSVAFRRISSKWNSTNPFGQTITCLELESRDITDERRHIKKMVPSYESRQVGSVQHGSYVPEPADLYTFADVALATAPEAGKGWLASLPAPPRKYAEKTRQPTPLQKPQPVFYPKSSSSSNNNNNNSNNNTLKNMASEPIGAAQIRYRASEMSSRWNQGTDGQQSLGLPVLVASAECELAHPRPSRSSETRLLRVLVKGRGEDSSDDQTPRRQSHINTISQTTGSSSAASFRTAPQSSNPSEG